MEFRVLTFNLHHHNDSKDQNAFEEQLDLVADLQPHVACFQEVEQFTGYNGNRDSAGEMISYLKSKWPGQSLWYYITHKGSTSYSAKGQYNMILTRECNLALIARVGLAYSASMLIARVTFNGRAMNFATFHLQRGQATPNDFATPYEGQRVSQQVDLNYNATNHMVPTSYPRFFVGDFNTQPGQPSLDPMRLWYNDLWQESPDRSQPVRCTDGETYYAGNPPSDATDYDRRIDYIFYGKKTWSSMAWVKPLKCDVVNNFRSDGSQSSDHAPLLGVFDIL